MVVNAENRGERKNTRDTLSSNGIHAYRKLQGQGSIC